MTVPSATLCNTGSQNLSGIHWQTVGPAAPLEVTTCLVSLLTARELLNSCKTGTDSKKYNTMAGIGVLTSCAGLHTGNEKAYCNGGLMSHALILHSSGRGRCLGIPQNAWRWVEKGVVAPVTNRAGPDGFSLHWPSTCYLNSAQIFSWHATCNGFRQGECPHLPGPLVGLALMAWASAVAHALPMH